MNGDERHFVAEAAVEGLRLDRALAHLLPEHSRSAISRWIGQGLVLVNGVRQPKPSHLINAGDALDVYIPPPIDTTVQAQEIPLEVLYQDSDIAIIDKPAGMVVHPAAGHADNTLVNALLFHLSDLSGVGGELRPGIVHRLDKDTSGIMVVAKNDVAHRKLTAGWRSGNVRKEYLALVYGALSREKGVIEAAIGRDPHDRKRMALVEHGRDSITRYKVEKRLRYISLLRCELETGRTHQIRVHLKSIGHPIVGDPLYSGPQWKGIPDRKIQKLLAAVTRQALHSTRLSFEHPRTGKALVFESALPPDLEEIVNQLSG